MLNHGETTTNRHVSSVKGTLNCPVLAGFSLEFYFKLRRNFQEIEHLFQINKNFKLSKVDCVLNSIVN